MALPQSLILASASPRRQQLLQQLGYTFVVEPADIEEQKHPGEAAQDYVVRLAREKAQAVASRQSGPCWVLGADTIVVYADQVMEKPVSQRHAAQMLEKLSGQTHQVMTAIAVTDGDRVLSERVTTDVSFCTLTAQDIADYWLSGEPRDKAGGYGIQGLGGRFVTHLVGSYFAVVGLPLYETEQLLSRWAKGESCQTSN